MGRSIGLRQENPGWQWEMRDAPLGNLGRAGYGLCASKSQLRTRLRTASFITALAFTGQHSLPYVPWNTKEATHSNTDDPQRTMSPAAHKHTTHKCSWIPTWLVKSFTWGEGGPLKPLQILGGCGKGLQGPQAYCLNTTV